MSPRLNHARPGAVLAAALTLGLIAGAASAASIAWTGGVNADWDINATANWTGDATVYNEGDAVTFDDTSANPDAVSLTTTLNPGSVTVDAGRDYAFGGAGPLTLQGVNAFTGDVDLDGGLFGFSQYGAALTEESYVFLSYTGARTGAAGGAAPVGYAVAYDDAAKTVSLVAIPEPSTLSLLILGLALVAVRARRRA
ncbi:MAG: PEP-CTERM sorting domain-containing protein [Pirellulales bacterium]|nr:PEP-CTERM sorting domain-containing protein [Pirellulales bacterium]